MLCMKLPEHVQPYRGILIL
uniref:Uncharacterized protein n=1 Tax=Arundo donax TaxID=35708 RepID=A0A0A8XW57_ARUDO